ncbi:MAG: flippase-like domain-containing protein [candidate division Zixibacteria bacterium]|nr:flippase-like domain-containing protein [candidate division Zixibacteria bacterium]
MQTRKFIRGLIGWALAAVILYILFRTVVNNWDDLRAWQWQIHPGSVILSVVFLTAAYIGASLGWRTIIAGFGHRVKIREAFRVVYLAQLGRYIPGKIWQVIGMVGLARELGIPSAVSLASFVLVQAYALPAAFLLIMVMLGSSDMLSSLIVYRDIFSVFMAVILLVFLILFFKPDGLSWALNKMLRLLKKEPVDYHPSFYNRISILTIYLCTWALFGFSFHFFLTALVVDVNQTFWYSAGTYIAAYNIGYIAFFSPGGLGFREGVMTALLAPALTQPMAASLALINRVWITIAEAIISLIALLTYKFKGRKEL